VKSKPGFQGRDSLLNFAVRRGGQGLQAQANKKGSFQLE